MPLKIDDNKLSEKYETIWTKTEELKDIELKNLPVYDDRSITFSSDFHVIFVVVTLKKIFAFYFILITGRNGFNVEVTCINASI